MSKRLDKALDLTSINKEGTSFALVPAEDEEPRKDDTEVEQIQNDFDDGRDAMHELLDTMEGAIGEMVEIAKQSQHPTAYSTLNSMIKNAAEMRKDILSLHSKKKHLLKDEKKKTTDTQDGETVNNTQQNIFVGTTAELAQLLKQQRGEAEDDE